MANIASNLYSAARQQASQGKTALERIRNKWNADIALMEQIGKITGNSMGASQAKARLAEFEKNLAYEVPAPTTDEEIQRIADVTFGGNTPSLLDDKYSGMRQRDVIAKVDDKINGLLDEYRNAQENLANATDFRKVSPEEQARILASPDIQALQNKVASFENELGNLQESAGITLDIPVLTRDAKGNYTSATTGERNRTLGRLGEGVKSRQTADGSWEVYGVNSGTVFQSGLADASAAEAWANKAQSGGTADATGAFGTSGGGVSTGSTAGDQALSAVEASVQQQEAAAVAQGIQVTPELRAMYLQQAWSEMGQQYGDLIRNAEFDFGVSMTRLIEDTRTSELALAQRYKENLEAGTSDLQNRGMLYGDEGSVRSEAERRLADSANLGFQALGTSFQRGLQDASVASERYLGSGTPADYALSPGTAAYGTTFGSGLGTTQGVGRVLAGSPVFSPGADINVYQPQGGGTQFGDINRDIQLNTETRANSLEAAERDRYSQFA